MRVMELAIQKMETGTVPEKDYYDDDVDDDDDRRGNDHLCPDVHRDLFLRCELFLDHY